MQSAVKQMDKESIIYDIATISDIPELVRLRILYMTGDFGSLTHEEREGMEKQLPGYFERELGKKLIAFVARAEGRLVAAAYLLIIEKPGKQEGEHHRNTSPGCWRIKLNLREF